VRRTRVVLPSLRRGADETWLSGGRWIEEGETVLGGEEAGTADSGVREVPDSLRNRAPAVKPSWRDHRARSGGRADPSRRSHGSG